MFEKPYSQAHIFRDSDSVALFTKSGCKVDFSLRLTELCKLLTNYVFSARADQNLLWEGHVNPDWLHLLRVCDRQQLERATRQRDEVVGMLGFHAELERLSFATCSELRKSWQIRFSPYVVSQYFYNSYHPSREENSLL